MERENSSRIVSDAQVREKESERDGKMTDLFNTSEIQNNCLLPEDEDPRTPTLKRVSYGIVLPAICCLGIIGNILNLVVLTRRNMRGTAYIYMRGERHLFVYRYLFLHRET